MDRIFHRKEQPYAVFGTRASASSVAHPQICERVPEVLRIEAMVTMRVPRTIYIVGFILSVGVIITLLNIWELRNLQNEHYVQRHGGLPSVEAALEPGKLARPVFWVKAKHADSGYLDHVMAVFQRLGFVRGGEESNWDVLWHHDYPFLDPGMRSIIMNLKSYQRVNHIPGSGYYTSKVNLAVSNITGIPPAFSLPDEKDKFLRFARAHPEKYWVQKSNKHRGIEIKQIADLDLSQANSFIQEYIAKPLLIDGRKFDIGVYTMITSMHPLRVYVYEADSLFRFCPKDYHPFDPNDRDKYVIGDDYTPMWEIKSLAKYYTDQEFTFRSSFNAYISALGKDPDKVWDGIRETIRQTLLNKQSEFGPLHAKYPNYWNFFELSRFDFVVDEDLNVFLMEANMSPNLSSGHFAANKLLYEQVLFNLFGVTGVAKSVHSATLAEGEDTAAMRASAKDLAVPAVCAKGCDNCAALKCRLCVRCSRPGDRASLRRAYLEHVGRGGTRRILPPPFRGASASALLDDDAAFAAHSDAWLRTDEDKLQAYWFRAKCQEDPTWCE